MPDRRLVRSMIAASAALLPLYILPAEEAVGYGKSAPNARQNAVLSGVVSSCREVKRQGRTPVAIFDLDATLFETGSRHRAIMVEFARRNARRYPAMLQKVKSWAPDELPYDVTETFAGLGLATAQERARAKEFWAERFFSNEYLHRDRPIAGAIRYVNALHHAGSVIVYLTGRNEKQMREGSRSTLAEAGFPVDSATTALLMCPRKGMRDSHFKGSEEVRAQISALGEVVAIFDNEPGNVNTLKVSFPDALTVFLDTNHSPGAPPVETGIPWIKNFRWIWLPW